MVRTLYFVIKIVPLDHFHRNLAFMVKTFHFDQSKKNASDLHQRRFDSSMIIWIKVDTFLRLDERWQHPDQYRFFDHFHRN